MRACVMRRGKLVVDTLPDPVPGEDEVLGRTLQSTWRAARWLVIGRRVLAHTRGNDG
jgi:hypothetical protein